MATITTAGRTIQFGGSAVDLAEVLEAIGAQPGDEMDIARDGRIDTYWVVRCEDGVWIAPKYDISDSFPVRL